MSKKVLICKDTPGGMHCSMVIVGDEADTDLIIEAGLEHAVKAHELEASPELRRVMRTALKAEEELYSREDYEDRFDMVHVHEHPPETDVDDEAELRGN